MARVFLAALADSDAAAIIEDVGETSGASVAARYGADDDRWLLKSLERRHAWPDPPGSQ